VRSDNLGSNGPHHGREGRRHEFLIHHVASLHGHGQAIIRLDTGERVEQADFFSFDD
jgi:hypothetical protein